MKRMAALFLVLFLIAAAGCNRENNMQAEADLIQSYQDIPGITEGEVLAIEALRAERDSITYGYLPEIEAFQQSDGLYEGFTAGFCRLLSRLFDIRFVQVPYEDRSHLMADVDERVIDFTGDLATNAGSGNIYYMTNPIENRMQKIVTLAGAVIVSESEINGLKLGFLKGSINIESIRNHYPDLSFETVEIDSIATVENMLRSGRIDAFITEGNLSTFFDGNDRIWTKDFFTLAYTPVSLATADPKMAPVISVVDKYLASGGMDTLDRLYSESEYEYTKYRLMKSLTEEEQAYLNDLSERGVGVNIALEHDNYPFSFYNHVEREFQGIAVDVLDEISLLTGIEFTNTTEPDTAWSEIFEALQTRKVSLVSQLGYTKQREENCIWSKVPYSLNNNFAFISKIDFPKVKSYQIPGLKIGVTDDTVYMEVYKEWFPKSNNLVPYPSTNDALDALERGEVDLVMCAESILLSQINYREKTGYVVNFRFNASIVAMFGFNKDEVILRDILDKAQQQIDTESIEGYWRGRVFDYSGEMNKIRNLYLSVFVCGMALVLIVMTILLIRNIRLRKRLVERTTMLSAIYASIPDLIFSKDAEGLYTSCNPGFERYAGATEAEVIGKTHAEVFRWHDPEWAARTEACDRRVIENNAFEVTEENLTYPDQTCRIIEMLKVPMHQNGKLVGLLGIGRDVTERNEVAGRLERIINTAQIVFLLSIDNIITEANEYSRKHLGVETGEDIRPIYSAPEQRNAIMKMTDESGDASNVIIGLNMANGESHRFLASCTLVEYEQRKARLLWAIDIEQEEKKKEQLYAARQSLQAVLDALPMPVRIVDSRSGEIVYVNNSLLELLEYDSADEVCGRDITDILPVVMSDGSSAAERARLVRESDDSVSVEIEYCTKTGRVIEAVVVSRRIDYNGRHSSIGIIKDLTADKEREQILKDAAEREKEANQSKSAFLANMSHEIRTPMNGVIGMTELLLGERLSERQLQYVKDIKISAESLLNIINDILDLSKITEGRLQIIPVDIDFSTMLKNTVSMMSFTARSKGLAFIDDIRIRTPEYVRVDDVRLKQVVVNLLSNAIKFTKEGHVKLSVKIEDGNILIQVSDTGIGIRQDELPLIFQAFEQADRRKNRAIKGTGLGLSISKNLVELMGGEIWAESEYGAGTTFFVTIPYVQGDESAVEAADAGFEYISAPTAQVLLVDDIQTNLTVGAGLLRHCKIIADVAVSGREAIELVSMKDYDIVFMDHMMPEMDGIEAMRFIRNMDHKYKDFPIIALTANAVSESKELLLSSGMSDFLSKPIDKYALMGILKKWLPPDKIEIGAKPDEDEKAAPYSKVLEEVSKMGGLDIGSALGRISGMQDVLEASIRQTAYSLTDKLKKMDAALARNDLYGFAIDAHGLKGALANIGATGHSEQAAVLEIAAKAENRPLCMEKFPPFASEMEILSNQIKEIFPKGEAGGRPEGDRALLRHNVEEAIDCLDRFETADALKYVNELENFTFGPEEDALLEEALNLIKGFKHKKAGLVLKNIILK